MKKDKKLKELLGKSLSKSELFHQYTKIGKKITSVDIKDWPEAWKDVYFKSYPRFNEIILPKPMLSKGISFEEVLRDRVSLRKFSKAPVSVSKLSSLLHYSFGFKYNKPPFFGRFYPSPGGRYPLEVYIISLNSELQSGLYHYYLKNHSLEELLLFNKTSSLKEGFNLEEFFPMQEWLPKVAVFIVVTAIFKRNTIKYGDRGYRHVLVEAGHAGQNLYLNCAAQNLACCGIGGYMEKNLEKLLDIDGINESVIYMLGLGNKS